MRPSYRIYSKEELSTDISNNNESIGVSTSYFKNDIDLTLELLNLPNRESRRKKEKADNPYELYIGRINPMYTKDKDFCQKEKKKQFNDFIKRKVK